MRIKLLVLSLSLVFVFMACSKKDEQKAVNADPNSRQISVEEILQAGSYTYLRGKVEGAEVWIAVTHIEAKVGDNLYYLKGMEMKNFESKSLNKKFDSIFFVDKVSNQPILAPSAAPAAGTPTGTTPQKPAIVKETISVEPAAGGITISKLLSSPSSYENKSVKVKGKITKFNSGIMGKNWAHIQDGTEAGGEFDLTVTTSGDLAVGDIVTFEGKITLNKDFGYGYSYKVMMEDAKVIK